MIGEPDKVDTLFLLCCMSEFCEDSEINDASEKNKPRCDVVEHPHFICNLRVNKIALVVRK